MPKPLVIKRKHNTVEFTAHRDGDVEMEVQEMVQTPDISSFTFFGPDEVDRIEAWLAERRSEWKA